MSTIRAVVTERLEIPLRQSFATAQDHLARQVSAPVAVHIDLDDGRRFTGEAVPVFYVTAETADSVVLAVESVAPALAGIDLTRIRPAIDLLAEALPNAPTARAGIEMAIYRAHAAALDTSLWRLFGGAKTSVETDITIPIVEDALERARDAAARGFRIFKLKIGSTDVGEDFSRLARIHEAVPRARFRVDANQAFEPDGALRFIDRALTHGIALELVEQPTLKTDLEALDEVARRSPVPVFADEPVQTPADALRVVRNTEAHGLNVKVMKSGISGALDIIAIARAAGRRLMIGCMLESRRGIAASLALACGTGAFEFVDLDSHLLLREQGANAWFEEAGPILSLREHAPS